MSNSLKVKLINFRDPDKIYVKFLEGDKSRNNDKEALKVNKLEYKLAKLSENAQTIENPTAEEIYGCYISHWKKWVRGKVYLNKSKRYSVFCIDHGMFKTKISKFINLTDELKSEKTQAYYKVSLGLTPLNGGNRWSQDTIDECRYLVDKENITINFVPFFEESNKFIGDLFLFVDDEHYSLSEKMISLGLAAKPSTDFNKIFNMLHDKEIGPLKTVQPKKRLEMYSEVSQQEAQISINLPQNFILHGNDLKPFWNKFDDGNFHNLLKKKHLYKNEQLNDIQKVIWPQIAAGKSSFVISANQDYLTSIYIQPLINKLLNSVKGDQIGPKAIIFANCSSRIDEIAMQCNNYANRNISIVKVVGICKDEQIKLMNGCDILITSPPAFIRLIQNSPYKLIDQNIIKHIVFDNFDQDSLNLFDKELNGIVKGLYSASNIPQTIVVAKTYCNGLKSKILNRIPTLDVVTCMDNYLDAAAFVGLSISIEISADSQDKINKLTQMDFNSYKKNLIVVNSIETLSILEDHLAQKALKCDNSKIAEIWDTSSPNNILIINDTILNDSIIQNADNLIHYDLPFNLGLAVTTSDQFSKRFKVFHNEIYKRLNSHEEKATVLRTKVILNNENVRQFEELINFLIGRNLLKANENVIEKIYEKNEAEKCANNVSLCPTLLQFGDCTKFNCVNRHKLSEQDKPPIHLEILKNFITFDLISQQGPTTFVIKIREYYDNKWISCVQSNEYIQQKLDVDMQRYCNEKSNELSLALNEGKVGEIYAKYDNKLGKWVRGRMIKRKAFPIVELSLLDNLPDIPSSFNSQLTRSHEKTLVKLPEEFTKLDPLLSKLQIMNLIPLDGEKAYNANDVDKLIRNIPKHTKFSARIEAIIGDVIFTKNIEAKNDKKGVIFRLTDVHTKLGISGTDESICKNIKELSSTLKEHPVENIKEEPIEEEKNEISITEQQVTAPKCWKQLKHDTSYPIIVRDYFSPYSFFVVLINQENLTVKQNLIAIEESQDHKQLISININECCLFYTNNRYLRAVILKISTDGQKIEVLLVDYGKIQKCDQKCLFEIPKEFLNFNFQTVHCSMLGICPKYNMKQWPPLQRKAVHELISKYNEKSLNMFVVKNDQRKHQFSEIGISSYDVQLYDDESKFYLSKLAVKQGIASECVEYNEEFYESSVNDEDCDLTMDTSSDISESNVDELSYYVSGTDPTNFTSNDSTEFKSSDSAVSMSTKTASITSIDSSTSKSIKSTESTKNTQLEVPSSSLKSIFNLPRIEWRQTDLMIYLLISANDCTEYALSIKKESLDVVIKYEDNKIERNIIQFYGSIKPKMCSHELAGNNIIVRLAKNHCGLNWPRLTMSKEKSIYIKFSNEKPFWNRLEVEGCRGSFAPDISDAEKEDIEDFESNLSDDDFFD